MAVARDAARGLVQEQIDPVAKLRLDSASTCLAFLRDRTQDARGHVPVLRRVRLELRPRRRALVDAPAAGRTRVVGDRAQARRSALAADAGRAQRAHRLPHRILDAHDGALAQVHVRPQERARVDVPRGERGVRQDVRRRSARISRGAWRARGARRKLSGASPEDRATSPSSIEIATNDAPDAEEDDATRLHHHLAIARVEHARSDREHGRHRGRRDARANVEGLHRDELAATRWDVGRSVFPPPRRPDTSIQSRLNLPRRPERDGPAREEERDERRASATGPL